MAIFYLIIIAKHRLPDTTFIYFLVNVSSKYWLGNILMVVTVNSLKQITFSHTYTHIEKVEKGKCITFYEMVTFYWIIIAKHRLSDATFILFF